jgi:hypothetical protein
MADLEAPVQANGVEDAASETVAAITAAQAITAGMLTFPERRLCSLRFI